MAALWPGVVVGEDAVTQAVIKLRKALQDPARSPRYIETISKRGYRLVASVEIEPSGVGEALASVSAGENDLVVAPRKRTLPLLHAGGFAALVGLLIAGGSAYHLSRQHTDSVDAETPLVGDTANRWAALPTIIVTPFETLDGEETYLARGLAADLMTDLSRLSALRVVSSQNHSRVESSGAGIGRAPCALLAVGCRAAHIGVVASQYTADR